MKDEEKRLFYLVGYLCGTIRKFIKEDGPESLNDLKEDFDNTTDGIETSIYKLSNKEGEDE